MSQVYIIGGLVDRNRHKGITARKAAEQVSENLSRCCLVLFVC